MLLNVAASAPGTRRRRCCGTVLQYAIACTPSRHAGRRSLDLPESPLCRQPMRNHSLCQCIERRCHLRRWQSCSSRRAGTYHLLVDRRALGAPTSTAPVTRAQAEKSVDNGSRSSAIQQARALHIPRSSWMLVTSLPRHDLRLHQFISGVEVFHKVVHCKRLVRRDRIRLAEFLGYRRVVLDGRKISGPG